MTTYSCVILFVVELLSFVCFTPAAAVLSGCWCRTGYGGIVSRGEGGGLLIWL